MGEKKRKRQVEEAVSPSKRVAFTPTTDIRVKHTKTADGISPILLSSPGLSIPKLQYKTFAKTTTSSTTPDAPILPFTHNVVLHSTDHAKLDYHATTSTLDPNTTHYLGIFDPTTNTLSLTPAHHVALRSALRSEVTDVATNHQPNQTSAPPTFASLRDDLGLEFGTKKMRKAIASRTDNAITSTTSPSKSASNVESAILDAVASTTTTATNTLDPSDLTAEAALLASKPMPMPNLLASKIEEVYPLSALVPAADRTNVPLTAWRESVAAEEDYMFNHRFPACRMRDIVMAEEGEKMVALGYLSLLLEFHDLLGGAAGRTRKVPRKEVLQAKLGDTWPMGLVESVRRRFADESGQALGKWQLDNLYTHMAALSLFVDGWVTDTSNLKDDLKMENKEMSRYFVELGCRVTNMTETERVARKLNKAQAAAARMAKLKLPLVFPKVRRGRKK